MRCTFFLSIYHCLVKNELYIFLLFSTFNYILNTSLNGHLGFICFLFNILYFTLRVYFPLCLHWKPMTFNFYKQSIGNRIWSRCMSTSKRHHALWIDLLYKKTPAILLTRLSFVYIRLYTAKQSDESQYHNYNYKSGSKISLQIHLNVWVINMVTRHKLIRKTPETNTGLIHVNTIEGM